MRSLMFRGYVASEGAVAVRLSDAGRARASRLVRSHRLWESYLAKHFNLPLDHLHMPAERMEHFITPAMDHELREQLTEPATDPHGRTIPEAEEKQKGK